MRIIALVAVAVTGVILCFLCSSGAREDSFALHSAVAGRDQAAVRELLVRGADPNAKASGSGETPLHRVEDEAIAGILIEAGADANVRDEKLLYLTILKFRELTPDETTFRSNIMYNVYDDIIMHLCKLRTPRAYHYLLELKKVSSDGRLTFLNEMEASYFRKFRDAKSKK